MENVNITFWVKEISLAANFGSTRSTSTSIDHKQRIEFFEPLTPPPPLTLRELENPKWHCEDMVR